MASSLHKSRLLRKVAGVDLFTRDAKRHESCQTAFITEYSNHLRSLKLKDSQTHTYNEAFEVIKRFIHQTILENKEIVQLKVLNELYWQELKKNDVEWGKNKSGKLKKRILNDGDIRRNLVFTSVTLKGSCKIDIIYSSKLTTADAIQRAYKLGSVDQIDNVALS